MTNESFGLSIFLLLVSMVLIFFLSFRETPIVVQTNLENIPIHINNYVGIDDVFPDGVYDELNADKHVYRHYTNSSGDSIDFYIGYYGTSKGGRTPHNPYACLPSQGWSILRTGIISVKNQYDARRISLNYVVSKNGNNYKYMIHWYQSARTKVLDSGFKRNIQRFVGKLLYNRNDGAYVQVSMTRFRSIDDEVPLELKEFAQCILNILPEYWPVEH